MFEEIMLLIFIRRMGRISILEKCEQINFQFFDETIALKLKVNLNLKFNIPLHIFYL